MPVTRSDDTDQIDRLVPPTPRGENFGPVVETGAGASTVDRMLGYLGRRA